MPDRKSPRTRESRDRHQGRDDRWPPMNGVNQGQPNAGDRGGRKTCQKDTCRTMKETDDTGDGFRIVDRWSRCVTQGDPRGEPRRVERVDEDERVRPTRQNGYRQCPIPTQGRLPSAGFAVMIAGRGAAGTRLEPERPSAGRPSFDAWSLQSRGSEAQPQIARASEILATWAGTRRDAVATGCEGRASREYEEPAS